jgi:hypothetical protein
MASRKSLKKFIGKEYISKDFTHHFRVLGVKEQHTNPHDPFRFHIMEGCSYYSYVPLTDDKSSAMTIKSILKDMIEITPAIRILYYPILKP